jgi:hypothetical protein
MAKSNLTISKLERLLDLKPALKQAEAILNRGCGSDCEDSTSENDYQIRPTYEEKKLLYNENINDDRKWLYSILLSDTESDSDISDEDKYVNEMLKEHVREKKLRTKYHQNPAVS